MRHKYFKKSTDYFKFFNKNKDFIKLIEIYFTKRRICLVYKKLI